MILSNITEDQLRHYLKGGVFKARYTPSGGVYSRAGGIPSDLHLYRDKMITCYQYFYVNPLQTDENFGDYRFNSGNIPYTPILLSELSDLEIVPNQNCSAIQSFTSTAHAYRIVFTDRTSVRTYLRSIGDSSYLAESALLPYYAFAEQDTRQDGWIKDNYGHFATQIDYCFYNPLPLRKYNPTWETIYVNKELLEDWGEELPIIPEYQIKHMNEFTRKAQQQDHTS